jgi:hypothetical protein
VKKIQQKRELLGRDTQTQKNENDVDKNNVDGTTLTLELKLTYVGEKRERKRDSKASLSKQYKNFKIRNNGWNRCS